MNTWQQSTRSVYTASPPTASQTLRDKSLRIEMDVWVAHDSVKAMVVGKRGAVIGEVGKKARLELEKLFSQQVHLILNVRVQKR